MTPYTQSWQKPYAQPSRRKPNQFEHARNSALIILSISLLILLVLRASFYLSNYGLSGWTKLYQEISMQVMRVGGVADKFATNMNQLVIDMNQSLIDQNIAYADGISGASSHIVSQASNAVSRLAAPVPDKPLAQAGTQAHMSDSDTSSSPSLATVDKPTAPAPIPQQLPADTSTSSPAEHELQYNASTGAYAYGQCTYYVARRRPVGARWGNARDWMVHAQAEGYLSGTIPAAGAIAWTSAGWYGHVAYVERVEGDRVLISEMNFAGWNVVSQRWVSPTAFQYIYTKPN